MDLPSAAGLAKTPLPAGPRSSSLAVDSWRSALPRPDQDAQRVGHEAVADPTACGDLAEILQLAGDRVASIALRVGALHARRQPAAVDAVQERLGKRADDGRDVVGDAPVVVVPPDAIALVDFDRGRALAGLDPVDVEEPIDRAAVPTAADAVDRLHEVAAEARRHLRRVALQQAHHRVGPAGLGLVGLRPSARRRSPWTPATRSRLPSVPRPGRSRRPPPPSTRRQWRSRTRGHGRGTG